MTMKVRRKRRGRIRNVFVPPHGWVQREDPLPEYERPLVVIQALGQTFPIYTENDELNFELTPEVLNKMTLYECGRCGAITGVGYKLGDLNVCYDCRMQNTRGYEKLSNEDRRVVTLVRGNGATVKMGISIVTNTASGAQSLVLKPKRAMSMEQ